MGLSRDLPCSEWLPRPYVAYGINDLNEVTVVEERGRTIPPNLGNRRFHVYTMTCIAIYYFKKVAPDACGSPGAVGL